MVLLYTLLSLVMSLIRRFLKK
ncbi:hypothetical protein [Metabacillus fastidiosus]|nr:hypothetical protein [Metabacillus fastidiosus]